MRGGFRRGRFDRLPQPGAVNSYSEAIYPPRVYHYYTQQSGVAASSSAGVIVPSIDDGVGETRGREAIPQGVGPVMDKKSPPLLRDFVGCFIDGNQHVANSRAFAVLDSGKEPLNVLHYPTLLGINGKDEDAGAPIADKNAAHVSTAGDHELRRWEDSLGLPAELRIYGLAKSTGDMPTAAVDRLRIRPSKRKRIVKPIRRGTKVVVLPPACTEDTQEIKKVRRIVGEEEENEGGNRAQPKRENDDRNEEGSGGFDREDDEASLSYNVDDDDDGGDLDGPEGSGGEDDFF